MTLSREQLILAECLARLTGAPLGATPKPAALGADRSRMRELAPDRLPWISIYPMERRTTRGGNLATSVLSIKVVLWVKADNASPIDEGLDPLYQWVHQQLTTDESLGGLATGLAPVLATWGFALHQAPFGDLDLHFDITYRHQAADPSRP